MSQLCTQLGHLVHLVNPLSSQEVQAIQVLCIGRNLQATVRILHRDDGLKDGTFAVLNPLTH